MEKDFAIIESGGKQYRIAAGEKLKVELLDAEKGASFAFDKVLLRSVGGTVEIGAPYLANASVEAKVAGDGRGEKKIIFKYHSKTRQRKKKGHRQGYTELEIGKI
jgi:large subunit ribosomal protein L21